MAMTVNAAQAQMPSQLFPDQIAFNAVNTGTAGDDALIGTATDDILDGAEGNDCSCLFS